MSKLRNKTACVPINFDMILSVILFVADRYTKYMVQRDMNIGESIPVINNVFHITYILNAGAAFGILENQRMIFVFIGIILLLIAFFSYRKWKNEAVQIRLGIWLLLSGALGNLIDRVLIGQVVDFFDFRIWPIFNVADIAIVVGVMLMMHYVIFAHEEIKS